MTLKSITTIAAAAALLASVAATAHAGTLENLERERAMLLESLLTPELTPEERHEKVAVSSHRLVDLERMVVWHDETCTALRVFGFEQANL